MSNGDLEPDHVAATAHLWYGHRKIRRRSELELCWKAAKAIAAGDGALTDEERVALVGKMTATAVPAAVIEAVMVWDVRSDSPASLLAHLKLPADARLELGLWIVYEGLSIGFADGTLALGERTCVHAVAETLGVPASTVEALISLCRDEALLRARRIKTLQGLVAITSSRASSHVEYDLVPITVRGEALKRAL
jgi:hypothetical protein